MSYNEPDYLPLWVRHYAGQVGAAHCYVVDHGSDDGSTAALDGVNVVRIPRSPQDDPRRARFMERFCAALLEWYDWVIHVDVDELLVADPARHQGLADFCATCPHEVVSAVGLDLQHVPELEAPIDLARPVSLQRRWVRFSSALCKPVLVRRPVRWAPGFHWADAPLTFDGLFLFHLRYYDRALGLQRLGKTRAMPWAIDGAGAHQRMGGPEWEALFDGMAALPRRDDATLDLAASPLSDWLDRVRANVHEAAGLTAFALDLNTPELWAIPQRFAGRF